MSRLFCAMVLGVAMLAIRPDGKIVKPKAKGSEKPSGLLGGGITGGTGGKVKLLHNKDCIVDIGTIQNPAVNCKQILNTTCDDAETGFYHLRLPNGAVRKAMCEMEFDGGGWTRILICGPLQAWDSFKTHDFIISAREVQTMAQNASQVHFRTKGNPNLSATSKPQTSPIQRLRKGLSLNDAHKPWEQFKDEWEGPYAERLSWNYRTTEAKPREKWPNVVWWAMNNGNGLHIINDVDLSRLDKDETKVHAGGDNFCHWTFQTLHLLGAAEGSDKQAATKGGGGTVEEELRKQKQGGKSGDSTCIEEPGRTRDSLEVYMR